MTSGDLKRENEDSHVDAPPGTRARLGWLGSDLKGAWADDIPIQELEELTYAEVNLDDLTMNVEKESNFDFDISELFSTPRVTTVAKEKGWKTGYAFDVNHVDELTGMSWDLLNPRIQCKLWGILKHRRSRLLICSPPCRTFSSLQRLRKHQCPGLNVLKGYPF